MLAELERRALLVVHNKGEIPYEDLDEYLILLRDVYLK